MKNKNAKVSSGGILRSEACGSGLGMDYGVMDSPTITPPASGGGKFLEGLAVNEAIVRDKTKAPRDRAVALCWVLHLVGDLHQPLHCVGWFSSEFPPPGGDHGGNFVAIRPKNAAVKLHAYWDERIGKTETPKYINDRANWVAATFPPGSVKPAELNQTALSSSPSLALPLRAIALKL